MIGKPKRRAVNATGRNKFDRHVRLHHWLTSSEAWRSLNPCARAALIELYVLYNGGNNGEIFMSVRYLARQIGVANGTAQKALADLQDRRFIKISEKGAFSRKTKQATTWILAEYSFAGQTPSKDFMRWKPTGKIQNTVSRLDTNGVIACYRRPTSFSEKAPLGVNGEYREAF